MGKRFFGRNHKGNGLKEATPGKGKPLEKERNIGKLNNKGLSLVEIIMAMVLLTIVVIPVLQVLVTTSGFNMKSRQKQVTMETAESVMELFKAYSVEELSRKFAASPSESGLKGAATGVKGFDATTGDPTPVIVSGDFLPSPNGCYLFQAAGVETDFGKYDIEVQVDKRDLVGQGTDQEVLSVADINGYKDALYMDTYDWYDQVKQGILEQVVQDINDNLKHPDQDPYAVSDFLDDFKPEWLKERVLILALKKEGSGVKGTFEVKYTYQITNGPEYLKPDGSKENYQMAAAGVYSKTMDDSGSMVDRVVFYDSTTTAATLENVYLLYYPNYEFFYSGVNTKDEVRIYSNLDTTPAFHVYRQKESTITEYKEGNYKLEVNYFEQNPDQYTNPVFYHNMNLNLHNMTYNSNGLKVQSRKTATPYAEPTGPATELTALAQGERLTDTKPLLYSVHVRVLEEGSSKLVCQLQGTMND